MDRGLVENTLREFEGKPFPHGPDALLINRIQSLPDVQDVEWDRNVFGRGRLLVRYRTPALVFEQFPRVAMDENGELYESRVPLPKGPTFRWTDSEVGPSAVIASRLNREAVLRIVQTIRSWPDWTSPTIELEKNGSLCLNRGEARVIFGSADRLDEKLLKLRELLDSQPGLLSEYRSINLMEPRFPAGRPSPPTSLPPGPDASRVTRPETNP